MSPYCIRKMFHGQQFLRTDSILLKCSKAKTNHVLERKFKENFP